MTSSVHDGTVDLAGAGNFGGASGSSMDAVDPDDETGLVSLFGVLCVGVEAAGAE